MKSAKADFQTRLASIQDYVKTNSDVNTGIDVDFAKSSGIHIKNTETPSEEIELFANSSNSAIALAWLEA
jgi:hypothetical protein